MKRMLAFTLATLFLTTAPVFAQEPGPGAPGHAPRHERFLKETDTNSDGAITKEEMRAAQTKRLDKMFEKVDADKNGALSKEELQKGREQMHKKMHRRFAGCKDGPEKAAQ